MADDQVPGKKKKRKSQKKKREQEAVPVPQAEDEEEVSSGSGERSVPGWVTTFADLMSLLMCFFVMLFGMSTMEKQELEEMVQSKPTEQKGGGAVKEQTEIEESEETTSEEEVEEAQERPASKLKELLKDEIIDGRIQVEEDGPTIKIQLMQSVTFAPGSHILKKAFKPVGKSMGKILAETEGSITVVGHTDNEPISSRRFRSNWELASARAVSVVDALIANKKLEKQRVTVRSYGDTRPQAPNDTPENRAKNRRVAIIVNQSEVTAKPAPPPTKKGKRRKNKEDTRAFLINAKNVDITDFELLLEIEKLEE